MNVMGCWAKLYIPQGQNRSAAVHQYHSEPDNNTARAGEMFPIMRLFNRKKSFMTFKLIHCFGLELTEEKNAVNFFFKKSVDSLRCSVHKMFQFLKT